MVRFEDNNNYLSIDINTLTVNFIYKEQTCVAFILSHTAMISVVTFFHRQYLYNVSSFVIK